MMILLIDNFDSFVFNLARYVGELGHQRIVKRNNELSLTDIEKLCPSHIILSPGPGTPEQAGISSDIVRYFGASIPIFGVCLGHQVIGQVYGAKISRAKYPMHGKTSLITHNNGGIFYNLENPLQATRYHSLIVEEEGANTDLLITAKCPAGEVMGLQHKHHPVYGVQFHPESVLTKCGHALIDNFIRI